MPQRGWRKRMPRLLRGQPFEERTTPTRRVRYYGSGLVDDRFTVLLIVSQPVGR